MKPIIGISINKLPYEQLKLVGTLLFEAYPTTIVYSDKDNNPVIKEWADCNEDNSINRYYYYETDRTSLKKYIAGLIPHIDLIKSSVENRIYFQDEKSEEVVSTTIVSIDSIYSSYLPKSDFYFDKNDGVDTELIINNFT